MNLCNFVVEESNEEERDVGEGDAEDPGGLWQFHVTCLSKTEALDRKHAANKAWYNHGTSIFQQRF